MHILLLPLIVVFCLFATPLVVAPSVLSVVPTARPSVVSADGLHVHFTKGGVVRINPKTGASRFTPYRLAPELDRRTPSLA